MGNPNQPVGHSSPIPGAGTNHAKVQLGRVGGGKPTKYGDSHLPNIWLQGQGVLRHDSDSNMKWQTRWHSIAWHCIVAYRQICCSSIKLGAQKIIFGCLEHQRHCEFNDRYVKFTKL